MTWLTERFGTTVPVVGAPMANVSGGRLTAAISVAGGLGMLGAGAAQSADWIRAEGEIAAASGRPYGVGLMAWLNIVGILILQQPAFKALRDYEKQKKEGKDPIFDPVALGIVGATFWESYGRTDERTDEVTVAK